jgi:cytochrome c554/c'-like protein
MKWLLFAVSLAVVLASGTSCSHSSGAPTYDSRQQLMDPDTCKGCHADHYQDWSGSMHAYASDDPVFRAMNARGQRETNGALGSFCVQCHAPMAVQAGATTDGTNLDSVPQALHGVTCFFCHSVAAVNGANDNPLQLSTDDVMRGPITDPFANTAHASSYTTLLDRDQIDSVKLCGPCHDIVNGHGAAIERTYVEWQASVFANQNGGETCGQCHLPQSPDLRQVGYVNGAPLRRYHSHAMPGVDLALAPFPAQDSQNQSQEQAVQAFLDTTLQSAVCVGQGTAGIRVILENVGAGHGFPSGASQDRRAWVEVIAKAAGKVIYQSGVVADGTPVVGLTDPDLWLLRDCLLDAQNDEVSMFWQAFGYESYLLPGQATFDQLDPRYYQSHIIQAFPQNAALSAPPDDVTMRVRLQPIGLDVLNDLVGSGDLDASIPGQMTTLEVGTQPIVEWTAATAKPGFVDPTTQVPFACVTNTSFNYKGQTVPAPAHQHCKP